MIVFYYSRVFSTHNAEAGNITLLTVGCLLGIQENMSLIHEHSIWRVWWSTLVILELGRQGQGSQKITVTLINQVNLCLVWDL